jgi:hypothetical protein
MVVLMDAFAARTVTVVMVLIVSVVVCAYSSYAQPGDASNQGCIELRRELLSVSERDRARFCERLDRVISACEGSLDIDMLNQESMRWTIAFLNTKMAEETTNRCQKYRNADAAVTYWTSYITWYSSLSDSNREDLQRAKRDRIHSAVNFLGGAIRERGEPPNSAACQGNKNVHELFKLYCQIPVDYFSTQSKDLWKELLWRCPGPEWSKQMMKDYQLLKQNYRNGMLSCEEEWMSYVDFLKSWIEKKERWITEGRQRNADLDPDTNVISRARTELMRLQDAMGTTSTTRLTTPDN